MDRSRIYGENTYGLLATVKKQKGRADGFLTKCIYIHPDALGKQRFYKGINQ